jgi:hypothetical protein
MRSALRARAFFVVVWGELLERGPAGIEGRALPWPGAHGQPLTRGRIKAGAIRLTHRLKRKRQYGRVPDQSFKIHVVVLNLEVSCFPSRVREKLLKLDFDGLGDVDETAPADADVLRLDATGDEDSLVDRLEPRLDEHRIALGDADEALAPLLGSGDVEREFTHLARVVDDVAHGKGERAGAVLSHGRQCYRREDGRGLCAAPPQMSRAPVSRNRATAGGTNGETSPPSDAT